LFDHYIRNLDKANVQLADKQYYLCEFFWFYIEIPNPIVFLDHIFLPVDM